MKQFCAVILFCVIVITLPKSIYSKVKNISKEGLLFVHKKNEVSDENLLLRIASCDPIQGESFYYPKISNLNDIQRHNERILINSSKFQEAYHDLTITKACKISGQEKSESIIKITYFYQGKNREAFAYEIIPPHRNNKSATLVIPGSGFNQSLAIAKRDPKNYHVGILEALQPYGGQVFILIKPNEDFLAWHDKSGKKVSGLFIWNWQINRGGSYSASYLIDSLAVIKYLKSKFSFTVLAGLSQGGAAVLLNALQSDPDAAIVSAGHTVINSVEYSGPDQIVGVPGYARLFDANVLKKSLNQKKTQWLFTFGKKDSDIYKMEANELFLAKALANLKNVSVIVHEQGHIFPKQIINTWINRVSQKAEHEKD